MNASIIKKVLVATVLVGVMVAGAGMHVTAWAVPEPEQPLPIYVLAPWDGIFTRGPFQNAPPYVEVGAKVEPNTIVGQVEQMRAFPLTAGCHGVVVEFLIADGEMVTAMQPLVKIVPNPERPVPPVQ